MTSPDPTKLTRPPRTALWLAMALLLPTPALPKPPTLPTPSIDWQPCGEAFPGIECATVTVPLDYDRPRGETIELALARLPAADPDQRIGTLFLNPGGPGGSGVLDLKLGKGQRMSRLVKGRFDIVGFDPRGVGSSTPIQCFDSNDQWAEFFEESPSFPYERFQEGPFFRLSQQLTKQCLDRNPKIAAHMSTADVARDLDVLRRAVGDEKLSYFGESYGTVLGQTYANLFPNTIRAMVIDGVVDPRRWSAGLHFLDDQGNHQDVFSEFLRLCDEAACALSGAEGAAARFDALAQALRASPQLLPDGSLYYYDWLIQEARQALYEPEKTWADYGAKFGAYADAVLGDATQAEQAPAIRAALEERWRAANPNQEPYDNSLGEAYDNSADAFKGVLCSDAEYPKTLTGFRVLGKLAEQGAPFGPLLWWSLGASCSNWPLASDRYAGPWRARTSAPVLVVGNYYDAATPYQGAVAASRLLPNSRLLSYAGWGHGAVSRSQCVDEHVATYLIDGTLPAEGTVCPANPNPFLANQKNQRLGEVVAELRGAFEKAIEKPVPSLNVLIQTPEGTYFSSSTVSGVEPVTHTTYFRFASITKTFTATAIMKMHQDGWLDYQDRIVDLIPGSDIPYVPDTPSWAIPYKNEITIRQLLQHNAGVYHVDQGPVPGCGDLGYTACMLEQDPDHQFTATEIVEQAAFNQLAYFPPGTDNHHYSNTGYTILGEIIARVYTQHSDGKTRTYSDYLYDHVFGPSARVPLDLHFPDLAADQTLPVPYVCGKIYGPEGAVEDHCADNLSAQVAEGNGIGTMLALNQWVRTLYQGRNVLDLENADLMRMDTTSANPNYGLGTTHPANLGYGHNGARVGYLSQATYDPELDVSVVVMMPSVQYKTLNVS